MTPTFIVCAAIVQRDGRYLVTRRLPGVHLEGYWEFPGGKCEAGETLGACLARELKEELNVDAMVGAEILALEYAYPGRTVELHFLRCDVIGEPSSQLGQEILWASRDDLTVLRLPPADTELIRILLEERQAT